MNIRERVRKWLGVEGIVTCAELREVHIQITSEFEAAATERDQMNLAISALRDAEERHYRDLLKHLTEVRDTLPRIEQLFHDQHLDRPTFAAPVMDWETIQQIELANMLAHPEE